MLVSVFMIEVLFWLSSNVDIEGVFIVFGQVANLVLLVGARLLVHLFTGLGRLRTSNRVLGRTCQYTGIPIWTDVRASIVQRHVEHVIFSFLLVHFGHILIKNVSQSLARLLGLGVLVVAQDAFCNKSSKNNANYQECSNNHFNSIVKACRLHVVTEFLLATHV